MPKAGAFYVMDRGYIDFERLFVLTLSAAFFVVRSSLKDTVAPSDRRRQSLGRPHFHVYGSTCPR